MNAPFVRTGPLRDPASYPLWTQQLIRQCEPHKKRAVEHELYRRMRDAELGLACMRTTLVSAWPVIEQFPLYMAQNLAKTRFGQHPGDNMARRYLIRNIRVEQNHADFWLAWAEAYDLTLADLQAQDVPVQQQALSHWCWHSSAAAPLMLSMAATNYAIEGATGEWSTLVCSTGAYEASLPEPMRKRAMKWLKMHAHYDDEHPWEALEIICTLAGDNPDAATINALRQAICTSYDYLTSLQDYCLSVDDADKASRRHAQQA